AFLADSGFDDLLLAYPTAHRGDAEILARTNARGTLARVVVDCDAHLEILAAAAAKVGARVPVVIDVDVSWRPLERGHVGVRRSPLRDPHKVVALARRRDGRSEPPLRRDHDVRGADRRRAGSDAGSAAARSGHAPHEARFDARRRPTASRGVR